MIGRTFSHYRVVERLGSGGMGEVYLARDEHLERDVAIKVLPAGTFDDASRRRFQREAKALSRVNHAHIATVFDFDTDAGIDFLVMEYVPGAPLSDRVRGGPLRGSEIVSLGSDIAAALEEAHDRGVVHRDLKPANVIVTAKGRAKVLDFGIAQIVGTPQEPAMTITDAALQVSGTLPYMAPEQLRGEPTDPRTDIYALGAVLFEMATGRRPYDDENTPRLIDAIFHAPLRPPSQLNPRLPADLDRIIGKCLERNPEDRYQSAKDLAIDLRRIGAPVSSTAPPPVPRPRPVNRLAMAGVAAAIVTAAAVTFVVMQQDRGPDASGAGPESIRSIVALPSTVHAARSDQFLTDAIPNTISTHLTQVEGLETRMPPSSAELARVGDDLGKLSDTYRVSAFVRSSLTAEADRFVLNLQLVDASSRRLLWSREFEGRRGNYLALVREAAEQLRVFVRPSAAQVSARAGTASSEAELAYQQGLHHFNRYNYQHKKEDFDLALAAYLRALQLDAKIAQAAAEIGWLHLFRMEEGAPATEMLPLLLQWGDRAIAIDPGNSRAWALLAFARQVGPKPDPAQALAAGVRAASRGPGDPFALNALGVSMVAISAELSLVAVLQAARIDPLYLYPSLNAAETLTYLGRTAEALDRVDGVLRVEPGMPFAIARRALVLIDMGRTAEAAALLAPLHGLLKEGRAEPVIVAMIEDGVALADGTPEARSRALDRLARVNLGAEFYNEYPPVYLWLIKHGRVDAALTALEARARAGKVPYDFLRFRPEFKAVASDPRFQRGLAASRAHFETLLDVLRGARERGEFPDVLAQPLADLQGRLAALPD